MAAEEVTGVRAEPQDTEPNLENPVAMSGSRRRWLWALIVLAAIATAVGIVIWAPWQPSVVPPPEDVRSDFRGATLVELRWDREIDGEVVDSFVILQGAEEVGTVDTPVASFTVTGLTPNTSYEFTVVSVDGDRRSEPSTPLTVRTNPGAPTSLRAAQAPTSLRLQWDEPAGPSVDSFVILQGDEEVGTVDTPEASFTVTGLTPNTSYEFTIVSVDGDRRSEPSPPVTMRTDPSTPTSLRAANRTATSMRLTWEKPAGPSVESYVVVNDGIELGTVSHPETSFRVPDLIPGASYDFAVIAEDGGRRSVPETIVATTRTPRPGGLALDAAATTTETIVFTWTPPPNSPTPIEYRIIRNGKQVATVAGDTPSYSDTGLAPATAYRYRVRADWGYEPSKATPVATFATVEPPLSDARLAGSWPVDITVVEDPGDNLEDGFQWSTTWDADPTCASGACDVTLTSSFDPPGFNYRGFTVELTRDAERYSGSTAAQITECGTISADNTVTVHLAVNAAGVVDGEWVARSWTGTLEIVSPYIDAGGGKYCPSQTVRADLTSAI